MAETIRKNVDLDILDYYDTKIKDYVDDKVGTGGLTIDTALSDTSTNPAQNKVIKAAIDGKADKTTATTDTDGLMSSSDKTKLDNADDTYALKSKYGDTTINVGRKAGSAVGENSTAEGIDTIASDYGSHAEGRATISSGYASHTEGFYTKASGLSSHAEGYSTTASGDYSHAEGLGTIASNSAEHASGQYNVSNGDTLFSVGDGTGVDNRHNAFEITKTGGKLHDRDIGISCTQAEADALRTEIPDDVDVAQWLVENAKSGMQYLISTRGNRTGLPNVSADWMWFSYDGNRYFARAWTGGTHTADYILDTVNAVGGWKEISYTPIKSTTFSGTTNEYGNVVFTAVGSKIPLFAECSPYCGIPLRFNDSYWIHCINPIASNNSVVANTAVSGTVYYVEI